MKKIFLLILGFVMFKVGYSQYPIQQFIGADSAVVTSKGGLQGRFINVVFADTTAANSQRVRQYPGAMIYASGKLWVRNTTATGWTELAYGPIQVTNIYNSDGTLTGNRELDGDGHNLTFTAVRKFSLSGDSLDYTLDPAGNLRIGLGNQQFIMRADTASLARRLSYTGNLGSSFTKHSVVDKNYVDSSITASPSGTVTSVGLSMPTAFAVANSPVTSSGTLTVTGAGVASQYIRGDGQLATLPTTGGGGSSVSYYLNGSVNQGTFGGTPYYEMSKTAIFGAGTDFTISSNGYIASFITDAGDPALLKIPGGNWNLEFYFSASSSGGTPSFYVELYKYDGTTFTLIASNSTSPEGITNGTAIDAYFTVLSVPETVLTLTDRLAIRVYVTHSGRTITLHTEDNHLCQIITTFSTGINALNGLTSQVQYLATGTSGTDFNINSATDTHTFNLPTASATNRGALSSADWTTFNSKIGPSDTASMLSNYVTNAGYGLLKTTKTLSVDTLLISTRAWRQKGIDSVASLANSKIGGSGTTNYVSKFTASGTIGNSQIFDNGTDVGFNTASPSTYLAGIGGNVIFRSGTSVGQSIATGSNNYVLNYLTTSNQYIWYPLPIGTRAGTLFTNTGNWVFGTGSTDGGYKVDIGGTLRASGDANINGLTVGKGGGSVSTNTAVGVSALNANTTAYSNTAIGNTAMAFVQNGYQNTSVGAESMTSLVGGIANVAVGFRALQVNTSSYQTGLGWNALSSSNGGYNTGIGYRAGFNVTTGAANIFLGYDSGHGITTGSNNVIIGNNVTGLSSSLSNTIILADGQGNQRLVMNSSLATIGTDANINGLTVGKGLASVAQNTAFGVTALASNTSGNAVTAIGYQAGNANTTSSHNTYIGNQSGRVATGANNTFVGSGSGQANIGGAQNTFLGTFAGYDVTSGTYNTLVGYNVGRGITTGNYNTIIGGDVTGLSSSLSNTIILADGQGNQRLYINSSGNAGIGNTSPSAKLDVTAANGEIRSTGTAAAYTQYNAFITSGVNMRIGAYATNFGYLGTTTNHPFTIETNSIERARFTAAGNVLIGTTTDAGYKLFVNGTAIVKEYLYLLRSDGAASIAALTYQPGNTIDIGNTFRVLGTNRWQNTVSSVSYIENNYYTKVFASVPQQNGSWTMYDFQLFSSMAPTIAASYNQKVIGTAFTIQSTAVNSFFGVDVRATDNSSSIANNVYGIYADATLGTNTSATRWAGYFVGRGYFSDVVGIGTTSPSASSILHLSSTTKGFLPPVMTGAQAEAIGTPAAGLMVYANNGNGVTITSIGWWGYNGTTWVKLN